MDSRMKANINKLSKSSTVQMLPVRSKSLQELERGAKRMQASSEKLERENEKMEERITALKETLKLEKQTRTQFGGIRWKSSQEQKPIQVRERPSKKMKIKVLSDLPTASYSDARRTAWMQPETSSNHDKCGQCEELIAKVECMECVEAYCLSCFKKFHSKGALRAHRRILLNKDGKKSIANPRSASVEELPKNTMKNPTSNNVAKSPGPVDESTMNNLAYGIYNEEENAKDFEAAVQEWRKSRQNKTQTSASIDTSTSEAACQAADYSSNSKDMVQTQQSTIHVKFSSRSTLSYTQKLALKRFKQNPTAFLSGTSMELNLQRPRSMGSNKTENNDNKETVRNINSAPNVFESNNSPQITPATNSTSDYSFIEPLPNRRTLSQMGKLNIIDMNFEDNLSKQTNDEISSNQNNKSPVNGTRSRMSTTPIFTPRPPDSPHNSRNARKSNIIRNRSNKDVKYNDVRMEQVEKSNFQTKNNDCSSEDIVYASLDYISDETFEQTAVKQQVPNYNTRQSGLSDFFTTYVEAYQNINESGMMTDSKISNSNEATGDLVLNSISSNQWKPESSCIGDYLKRNGDDECHAGDKKNEQDNIVSYNDTKSEHWLDEARKVDDAADGVEADTPKSRWPHFSAVVNAPDEPLMNSYDSFHDCQIGFDTVDRTSAHLNSPIFQSPRVSWSEYDFLQAPPPSSKGDDFEKIHRASTVTLYGVSPQPHDVWEIDSDGVLFDEMTKKDNAVHQGIQPSMKNDYDSDSSIEINDSGSGLTSVTNSDNDTDAIDNE